MSVLGVSRLIRAVEHKIGVLARLTSEPDAVIDEYAITDEERSAILELDARRLTGFGVNPLLVRTLLILCGVRGDAMYSHAQRLPLGAPLKP